MNNVFVLSGPSGSGQDSIIESLSQEIPFERVITTTTRKKRPTESEAKPYHFVSHEEFKKMQNENKFIEQAQSYNGEWYGVTEDELNKAFHSTSVVIWKVDYKGVRRIKELFPQITTVLIEVPEETLRKRLQKRDNPDKKYLEDRMSYSKEWKMYKHLYDYSIQNEDGKLKEAVNELKKIILRKEENPS